MSEAKVYMTEAVNADSVLKLYEAVAKELAGKVAVKVHSGEVGN